MLRLVLFLCLAALPLRAEEVVLGLSSDRVRITATFEGSEILVFGAIKREAPIPEEPLDVVVAIAGPSKPLVVRRKERVLGIWANTDAVGIDSAPSFYAVATTGPMRQVLSNVEDLRHKVSIGRAIRSVGAPGNVADAQAFTDALIRIRQANGTYQMLEGEVVLDEQTLFRTEIGLPANLTEGEYQTRIFLTRGGNVISQFETVIDVRKVGLERWLYTLSHQQPLAYGLMSLAIAIAAGWGASAAFRMLRQGG
ncbi:TIGR02186 family protein [Roseovarius sp. PS-C2]|uniref:TIGR02186 family protein n=1 Tax=Roseovarius sp. PS-C2 TaxID=2820814 RepID=UPI001C0BEDE6|nr:TIGR02186 family protein [Roseovarius sp. PS-C2]MBU3261021.1 TIGR02186 family protein [Roseovarius sp. PS-C2]